MSTVIGLVSLCFLGTTFHGVMGGKIEMKHGETISLGLLAIAAYCFK